MQHLAHELPADPADIRLLRFLIIILLLAPIVIIGGLSVAIAIAGPNY